MTTILNLEARTVPLTRLDNGVYRVTGARIPLERVIESHRAGATPQEIVDSFDTLRLADVYSLIGYYLDHQKEVEQYLREQEEEGEKVRHLMETAQPARPGFKEELLRRKMLLEDDTVFATAETLDRIMAEDDTDDPTLEGYQSITREA